LNAEFGVFTELAAAASWLASEDPTTSAATMDAVLPEAPDDYGKGPSER
jgi:hypothetical protein